MRDPVERQRLQKYLAARGAGSRRRIEQWIAQGKISVDGKIARPGDRVAAGCRIRIDGKPVPGRRDSNRQNRRQLLLYNKPEGEICTRSDPANRPTVFRNLPPIKGQRWVAVGRLDINTRGLLLFTNDGELANRLMHPRLGFTREYLCRVFGQVTVGGIAKLQSGIRIDGVPTRFDRVRALSGPAGEKSNRWYSVTITEGKYRAVRRMWEAIGCQVNRLNRIRYGALALPRGLKPGHWIQLPPEAITIVSGNPHGGRIFTPKIPKKRRSGTR